MTMRHAIAAILATALGACVLVGYLVGIEAAFAFVGCILLVVLFGSASVWFSVITRRTDEQRDSARGAKPDSTQNPPPTLP